MRCAQITDTHVVAEGGLLFGRVDTGLHLEQAIQHLNRLGPDFVLLTGDLVDDGSPAAYANLKRLLAALRAPYAVIPGNHDDRANLQAAFPELPGCRPEDRFVQFALDDFPLRLIGLDTVVPGEAGGTLCAERLDWLARRLAEAPGRPTLVAMHHPPFATGIAGMDAVNCANADALAALLVHHPQVERIVCGHVHRPIAVRWAGTLVTIAPSTTLQVALDLAAAAPVAWRMEPPACQLHCWSAAAGLVTHTSYVGDYGPAVPFD